LGRRLVQRIIGRIVVIGLLRGLFRWRRFVRRRRFLGQLVRV
jgi:hypothetical protein